MVYSEREYILHTGNDGQVRESIINLATGIHEEFRVKEPERGDDLRLRFMPQVFSNDIIRFRTAVKETQGIMFIFYALAIGMTCGVRLFDIAIAATLLTGIILLIIIKTNLVFERRSKYLLQFHYTFSDEEKTPAYLAVLRKFCKNNRLINSKTLGDTDNMEFPYYVELRNVKHSNQLLRELKHSHGVTHAHLFFEDERL